jgi:hypothetical protein
MILRVVLIVVLAAALAAFTYLGLERAGRRGWIPMVCRAVAWAALGFLLLNVSCPVAGPQRRPLVLLDASLSMTAPGGRWAEARDSAARWGDVTRFGDERGAGDTLPNRGRSLLAPALTAAAATDRPVVVVTDGEFEDAPDIPADLLARVCVRLFPRAANPDLAITRLTGPARVAEGDTITLELEVQAVGGASRDSVSVEARLGGKRLAGRTLRLRNGSARGQLAFGSAAIGAGDHLLRVAIADSGDAEPRTDARLHLVTVTPTPGVVLLATPADWDSRFLFRTLRDVAQLPVRGYLRLVPDRWRSMTDLAPISAETVRQAARRADLLIEMGDVGSVAEGGTARGMWRWIAGADTNALMGDWYLQPTDASPVAGAFLGQPVDSFPPMVQLSQADPAPADWIALYGQLGRRGARRPAVFGGESGRVRRVVVAVNGLWRWAFRGGSSEQAYRTWVAATTSWLLGAQDTTRGAARPVRPVVENGRPVVFEWLGQGAASDVGVAWSGEGAPRTDTLRFDGAGHADVWLTPGQYHYRLARGAGGLAGVEQYSEELLPRSVALTAHEARPSVGSARRGARDWVWLFGLAVLALAGEWLARRRLGLR